MKKELKWKIEEQDHKKEKEEQELDDQVREMVENQTKDIYEVLI